MTTGRRVAGARPSGDSLPPLTDSRYDSFVVRVCHRGGVLLHGEVIHVSSRRSRPFADIQAVLDFIQTNIGGAVEPSGLEPPA